MTAYVCLGKIGDIINILPILHAKSLELAEKPVLVVSKQYASLVEGLTYLTPVIYDGSWEDINGAILFAKRQFSNVVVLSISGKDFQCQRKTPSFLMEPWERAGMLSDFDCLPLVITGRNFDREMELFAKHTGKGEYVVYADHGESSPFYSKEKLYELMTQILGKRYHILRMSEVRATHFFDLLMLLDRAKLIVSTETAHLHLTRAVKTPVIAFTHDLKSRWHGTPHCRRFRLTCRYSDFDRRRPEIISSLQDPEGISKITNVPVLTSAPFGYNPTIMDGFPGMIFRHHPDKRSWKTKLVYQSATGEQEITFPEQFEGMSLEDARLFKFKGEAHISFVAARHEFGKTNAVTGYGKLALGLSGSAHVENVCIPEFGLNNWGGIEKNWLFFEHHGRLFCIYDCDGEQIILEVNRSRVREVFRSPSKSWEWGKIRGGCIVPWKGRLLRFFHSHSTEGRRDGWIYSIGAVTMEDKPPFRMMQISKSPIIWGEETLNLFCRHWKANVCFPGGVCVTGESIQLAYGYNDSECRNAFLTERDLNL